MTAAAHPACLATPVIRGGLVIVNAEGLTDELDRVAEAEAEGLGLPRHYGCFLAAKHAKQQAR